MSLPLSFSGRIRPLAYLFASLGVFLSQHLTAIVAFEPSRQRLPALAADWHFYVMPLQTLAKHSNAPGPSLILALAALLLASWALSALAFRRAADADVSGWIAAFAIAPVVQIPTIVLLSVLPSRRRGDDRTPAKPGAQLDWATASQGLVIGVAVTLFAVAVSTLLFGAYGFGVFVASPFIIGATTGYFANRKTDVGSWPTAKVTSGALLLGGLGLVIVALEGLICTPDGCPSCHRHWTRRCSHGTRHCRLHATPAQQALSGLALLPLIFALESSLPMVVQFETHSRIQSRAPPSVVWKVLVNTDLSHEPVALPFRWGLAYPIRGEVLGEGIGSIRIGEFSTGSVRERVTEWIPNRKLAFVMLNEVPAVRELSPYATVHAPHVVGYFRTTNTSFELAPLEAGGTELIERTSHELRLEPVPYWLPLARWVVHENNARVLTHIKRQAEKNHAASH
jgi:uncharacterized membrane protein YhaH (DUF805 family)